MGINSGDERVEKPGSLRGRRVGRWARAMSGSRVRKLRLRTISCKVSCIAAAGSTYQSAAVQTVKNTAASQSRHAVDVAKTATKRRVSIDVVLLSCTELQSRSRQELKWQAHAKLETKVGEPRLWLGSARTCSAAAGAPHLECGSVALITTNYTNIDQRGWIRRFLCSR